MSFREFGGAFAGGQFLLKKSTRAVKLAIDQPGTARRLRCSDTPCRQPERECHHYQIHWGGENKSILREKALLKPIEQIAIGDTVWGWDEDLQQSVAKKVNRIFIKPNRPTFELRYRCANDECEMVRGTEEHPFWVIGKGWTPLVQLREGDLLQIADGRHATVDSVLGSGLLEDVFNFEVDDVHNYYIGSSGVLVHNTSGPSDALKRTSTFYSAEDQKVAQHNAAMSVAELFKGIMVRDGREPSALLIREVDGSITTRRLRLGERRGVNPLESARLQADFLNATATLPKPADVVKSNLLPGQTLVGAVHGHPVSRNFSLTDIHWGKSYGIDIYVVHKGGEVRFFPADGKYELFGGAPVGGDIDVIGRAWETTPAAEVPAIIERDRPQAVDFVSRKGSWNDDPFSMNWRGTEHVPVTDVEHKFVDIDVWAAHEAVLRNNADHTSYERLVGDGNLDKQNVAPNQFPRPDGSFRFLEMAEPPEAAGSDRREIQLSGGQRALIEHHPDGKVELGVIRRTLSRAEMDAGVDHDGAEIGAFCAGASDSVFDAQKGDVVFFFKGAAAERMRVLGADGDGGLHLGNSQTFASRAEFDSALSDAHARYELQLAKACERLNARISQAEKIRDQWIDRLALDLTDHEHSATRLLLEDAPIGADGVSLWPQAVENHVVALKRAQLRNVPFELEGNTLGTLESAGVLDLHVLYWKANKSGMTLLSRGLEGDYTSSKWSRSFTNDLSAALSYTFGPMSRTANVPSARNVIGFAMPRSETYRYVVNGKAGVIPGLAMYTDNYSIPENALPNGVRPVTLVSTDNPLQHWIFERTRYLLALQAQTGPGLNMPFNKLLTGY